MMQISSKPNTTKKIEPKAAAPAGKFNGESEIRPLSVRRSGNNPTSPSRVDVPGNLGKLALDGILKPHTRKPCAALRTKSSSSRSAQALTAPSASLVSTSLVPANGQHLYFVHGKTILFLRRIEQFNLASATEFAMKVNSHWMWCHHLSSRAVYSVVCVLYVHCDVSPPK